MPMWICTSQFQEHRNLMSPSLNTKGKYILSPSTNEARGQVVHTLTVQALEIQEENQHSGKPNGWIFLWNKEVWLNKKNHH
jgi:hypothetical protein